MGKRIKKLMCLVLSVSVVGGNVILAAPVAEIDVAGTDQLMEPAEYELDSPADNLALTAVASSSKANPQYPGSFLNDGKYGNGYGMVTVDNVEVPTYETFVWEKPQTFDSVNMVAWWSQNQAPINWDIEVSENGVDDWRLVANSGDVTWDHGDATVEHRVVTFDIIENVKGMRVVVNEANREWLGKFSIQEIEVFNNVEATLESLKVTKEPTKLFYGLEEELDLTGMEVKACYSNGTAIEVKDYTVTGYNKYTSGKQTVELFYTEGTTTVTARFQVTVVVDTGDGPQPVLDGLDPNQWVYQFGDEFYGPELSDLWEPSYFPYWSHSSQTSESVYDITDGILSQNIYADSPYYDITTDYGFRNPGMSLGVRDYVHMYRDNLVQYRHMPTNDKYATKYGYYELRAKLNNNDGSCCAWWMTGFQDDVTDTAEIDIIEYAGGRVDNKNKIGGWMYNWDDPKLTSVTNSPILVDFNPDEEYHVYGMEWQPGYLKFYVDGELMSTINQSPDYRMLTWISYNHHDSSANKTFPKSWGIDYFRVWQDQRWVEEDEIEEKTAGINLATDAYAGTVGITAAHYKKNPPYNMNDEDESTSYRTMDNSSFPYYLYLDWTEPQTINTLTLKAQKDQAPTDYDIEYSADGKHGWGPAVQNEKPEWQNSDGTVESHTTYFETLEDVKYIRVRVNAANTIPGYFAVNELEASYNEGVTPTAPPTSIVENYVPYAEITSTGQNVHYPVGDIADEVYINEYRSENNPQFPYYINMNWDEGKTFSEVAMTSVNCFSSAPYDFEIQVSDDGNSDWETVAAVEDDDWVTDGMYETQYIEFPQAVNKKGCRIKVNKAYTTNGYFKVSEVEVNSIPTPEDRKRKLSVTDNLAIFAVASSTSASAVGPAHFLNDGSYNRDNGMISVKGVKFPTYETFTWTKPQSFDTVNMASWWCKDQAPTNWDIEVSKNGVDGWTRVASSDDVEWAESSTLIEHKAVTFPLVENVKGVRVKVNSANTSWENKFVILEIEVFNNSEKRTLDSLEIAKEPVKLAYEAGEELDLTGMEVTAHYSDGTNAVVTDYMVPGYDKDTSGEQTIEVTYAEGDVTVTATFIVTILPGEEAVDKTLLQELYDQCKNLTQGTYTDETWNIFIEAREEAKDILELESAAKQQVHDAWIKLFEAKVGLTESVNKELLIYAIAHGEAADTTGCTPESIKNLEDAIDAARTVRDNPSATEDQVQNAIEAVMNAIIELVEEPKDIVDKTLLEQLADIVEKLTGEKYTPSTWEKLKEVLDAANDVLEDDEASQTEVDDAYKKLAEAMMGLKNRADKNGVETAIGITDKIVNNAADYVDSTIAGLDELLAEAMELFADSEAEQKDVDVMAKKLLDAVAKARLKANTNALKVIVNAANEVDVDLYTDETVQPFEATLAKAVQMLADETLSEDDQDDVDEMTETLLVAMNALVAKEIPAEPTPTEEPESTKKPGTSTKPGATTIQGGSTTTSKSPKTGDTSPIAVLSVILLLGAAGAIGLILYKKKGRRKETK